MNAIQMEEELLEARTLITTYEVMEDNTQELERQNRNLKRCLTELAGEFDTYCDCTILPLQGQGSMKPNSRPSKKSGL
jgi:hypothetical protein